MKADINGGPQLCYLIFTLIKISKNWNFCHLLCLLPNNNTICSFWTLARFLHFSQLITPINASHFVLIFLSTLSKVVFGLVACCLPEIFSSSHFSAGSRLFSVFCTTRFVSDHVFSICCPHLWGQQTCESARIFASHYHRVFRYLNFSVILPSHYIYISYFYAQVYSLFPIN